MASICLAINTYSDTENKDEEDKSYSYFTMTLAIAHICFALAIARVGHHVPSTRAFVLNYVIYHCMTAVPWAIISLFCIRGYFFFFCMPFLEFGKEFIVRMVLMSYVSEPLINMFHLGWTYTYVPMNVSLSTERFALLFIISLGEILTSFYTDNLLLSSYSELFLVTMMGFIFKFAYFNAFDYLGEHAEKHAYRISIYVGLTYAKSHALLIGSVFASVLYLEESEEVSFLRQGIFTVSTSLVIISCCMIDHSHLRKESEVKRQYIPKRIRVVVMGSMLGVFCLIGQLKLFQDHYKLNVLAVIVLTLVLFFEWACVHLFLTDTDSLKEEERVSEKMVRDLLDYF